MMHEEKLACNRIAELIRKNELNWRSGWDRIYENVSQGRAVLSSNFSLAPLSASEKRNPEIYELVQLCCNDIAALLVETDDIMPLLDEVTDIFEMGEMNEKASSSSKLLLLVDQRA